MEPAAEIPASGKSFSGRRQRRPLARLPWLLISVSIVGIGLLVTGGIVIHKLWNLTTEWQVHAEKLDQINYDLGSQLTEANHQIEVQADQIKLLSDQLSTAQQKITDLANATAKAGDEAVFYQEQIATLENNVIAAASVANALNRCVEAQAQMAEYNRNADDYNPVELAEFAQNVYQLCDNAISANSRLQQSVNR